MESSLFLLFPSSTLSNWSPRHSLWEKLLECVLSLLFLPMPFGFRTLSSLSDLFTPQHLGPRLSQDVPLRIIFLKQEFDSDICLFKNFPLSYCLHSRVLNLTSKVLQDLAAALFPPPPTPHLVPSPSPRGLYLPENECSLSTSPHSRFSKPTVHACYSVFACVVAMP